jgi:hypothetical protein
MPTNEDIKTMIMVLRCAEVKDGVRRRIDYEAADMLSALLAEREWRPIAEYDAMPQKKRPVLAMFLFAATKPTLSQRGFLAETWRCTRDYGSRECISYFPIPLPARPENE